MKHFLFLILMTASITTFADTVCDDAKAKLENISPDDKVSTFTQYTTNYRQCLTENGIIDPSQSLKSQTSCGIGPWCFKSNGICWC